jgi:hypothetical protein
LTCTYAGGGGDPVPAPASSFNCPAGTYAAGDTIALIAKPNANQRIKKWTGTDTTPDIGVLVNTLTMPNTAHTVKAEYEACFSLSAQVSGSGDALSAIPAASIGCAAGRYVGGQSIVLTSAPATGWKVEGWNGTSDDGSKTLNNNVIMPAGDHIVGVTYKQTEKTEEPDLLYLPALLR